MAPPTEETTGTLPTVAGCRPTTSASAVPRGVSSVLGVELFWFIVLYFFSELHEVDLSNCDEPGWE